MKKYEVKGKYLDSFISKDLVYLFDKKKLLIVNWTKLRKWPVEIPNKRRMRSIRMHTQPNPFPSPHTALAEHENRLYVGSEEGLFYAQYVGDVKSFQVMEHPVLEMRRHGKALEIRSDDGNYSYCQSLKKMSKDWVDRPRKTVVVPSRSHYSESTDFLTVTVYKQSIVIKTGSEREKIKEEIAGWRIFPDSPYDNQVHIFFGDRMEILEFA